MIPKEPRGSTTIWQVAMFVLCLYVLLALAAERIFALPEQVAMALNYIDFAICILFIADFLMQLFRAENKLHYFFTWGWIDLISSIPNIDILRWGRLARIFRIMRLLRAVRSTRLIFQVMFTNRTHGTFASAALTCFILIIFATISILYAENDPKSNIKTAGDALWWAFTTLTTVGYGDYFPVTFEGRIIAAVLMTAGIALFGTFTAYVASWFFKATGEAEEKMEIEILKEINEVRSKVDSIERRLNESQQEKK